MSQQIMCRRVELLCAAYELALAMARTDLQHALALLSDRLMRIDIGMPLYETPAAKVNRTQP